jgi:uncharacterized protein
MAAERDEAALRRLTEALRADPDLVLAIVFGSIVPGGAGFESDVDLAVLTGHPLDSVRSETLIRTAAGATGRPVDLVDLRETGVPLLRTILRDGRTLLSRDRAARDRLVSRMLADVEDLLPLQDHILRERRRRWTR